MDNHQLVAHRAAVMARRVLPLFEKRYVDRRPRNAIEAARAWSRGDISVNEARHAAFAAHSAAHKAKGSAAFAARAAAHAAATAHVRTHFRAVLLYVRKAKKAAKEESSGKAF